MSDLIPFDYGDRQVRTVVDLEGEPWFVAADVCAVLGLGNASQAVGRLDEDEKGIRPIDTPGGRQHLLVVDESGLYALILRSDKPEARPFRRWVTSEVLPTIRKTGSYSVARSQPTSIDALRGMLDQIEAAQNAATRAEETAGRAIDGVDTVAQRVDALEGNHGWYSALAYAKRQGWSTDVPSLNALGRRAGQLGRNANVRAAKVPHPLYGEANAWPEWVWDQAYQDGAGE